MRFASFRHGIRESWGMIAADGVVDLGVGPCAFASLLDAIRAGGLEDCASLARKPDYSFEDITFLPPVRSPDKIICVGVNYANRNAEYKDESAAPKYPSLFVRFPGSFVGHKQPLVRPRLSHKLDYEGEIVLVIGKAGRAIPRDRALDMICGMTLCNEGSVRDWLRHGKFNVTQGKNFDGSGSMGPWMVTSDELSPEKPLHLTTRVNGEVRQNDTTENLIFDFPALISYISSFTTLMPGDLIVSGTPVGAGARFDPPRWLLPGDVVEVEVPGIGTLCNGVIDESM
jgi:5-carboxymethyl-2-hydroxymuconate isomerase